MDFKDKFQQNVNIKDVSTPDIEKKESTEVTNELVFKIGKKQSDKVNKKTFNVYMEDDLVKELDRVSKKTGYSRNEVINLMCEFCLNNLEIK